jgi:16S rRNA C1402 (ribose-2'-O) methylase RsmI
MKGNIYLIPNTLGVKLLEKVFPKDVQSKLGSITYLIVENERTARAFIKSYASG